MTHPKQKATYYYKLFRVTRKCGKITTVSVDPILVTKACQVMGGLRNVGKLVRDAAFTYEAGMQKKIAVVLLPNGSDGRLQKEQHSDSQPSSWRILAPRWSTFQRFPAHKV